jgi:hypothetical protein
MKPFGASIKFVHVLQQFGAIIGNCLLEGCEPKFKDFLLMTMMTMVLVFKIELPPNNL